MTTYSYKEIAIAGLNKKGYHLLAQPEGSKFIQTSGTAFNFIITLEKDNAPLDNALINYKLVWDQDTTIEEGQCTTKNGQALVKAKSDKPGFMQIDVTFTPDSQDPMTMSCGAGISPESLAPSMDIPDDFDDFWKSKLSALAEVPIKTTYQKVDKSSHPHLHDYSHAELLTKEIDQMDIDYVSIDGLDCQVKGVYARPKETKTKGHPAVLFVQGAGVVPVQPAAKLFVVRENTLSLEINAHGIRNDQPESYYQDLLAGDLFEYKHFFKESRETSYWLGLFLRVRRALDFLKDQPEWDGKNLWIRGGSQGGAQAIAGAYLDPDVSAFSAAVPGHCDHTGFKKGRICGWPTYVEFDENNQPNEKMVEAARYFDGMNFLRRTKAPGIFSVGFLDNVCRPTSIYTAYNVFQGRKSISHQPFTGHEDTKEALAAINTFFAGEFKRT